ncbi:hypothetical protein K504DRAFT_385139 [Pleomassaria siparia CBS 279.74]|uniref:F-box domain-containing protein n=1 Tax=Pleomassaria siparia CBS 279.74 TaxID=1314801 RepID=A0A6G1K3A1_9PLEO|nr:hypothetical protein K504DRAFT_385139 [Pleomassaria siparia CBS 279.74]
MGFAELPAELQIEILSYLERPDLKAARAVSRSFRDNTSPSLFKSTVACPRYQALGAMQKISLHSVYQIYVKTIIFDGSVYDGDLANNEQRYLIQADECAEINTGFRWEKHTRYKRYQQLFREQEDMRTGGVLFAEISRALEWMVNVSSLVYSPGPRNIPIERKTMKDILPRGIGGARGMGVESYDSFIKSNQHGIHYVIGAIYASQYTGIHEFRVETVHSGHENRGTEFTIFVFDFPDPMHLEAGRFFFRQLHKLKLNMSLQLAGTARNTAINPPPILGGPPGFQHANPIHQINFAPGAGQAFSAAQLVNFASLLREAKNLRELSFHLAHWRPSANLMYGHLISPNQAIFPHLGLSGTWTKLRSLSLGGIYGTEKDFVSFIRRHKDTLKEVEFKYCSLTSGLWASVVDEILENTSIFPFTLNKVNETIIGDAEFHTLVAEEQDRWQYVGKLSLNAVGLRYFVS